MLGSTFEPRVFDHTARWSLSLFGVTRCVLVVSDLVAVLLSMFNGIPLAVIFLVSPEYQGVTAHPLRLRRHSVPQHAQQCQNGLTGTPVANLEQM